MKFTKKIDNIKFKLNRWKRIPYSTCLCLRFPFLYPRNRFTGLHYNNWKLIDKLRGLSKEAYHYGGKEEHFAKKTINKWKAFQYVVLNWIHRNPLQWLHCLTCHTELDAMDIGWKKTFGIQMCREIKRALLDEGGKEMLHSYRITQIKEKYGQLCWYDAVAPHEVHKIVAKYEYISGRTCINCGRTADGLTRGYILPLCKHCAGDEPMDEYYTEDMPFYGHYYLTKKEDHDTESKENS